MRKEKVGKEKVGIEIRKHGEWDKKKLGVRKEKVGNEIREQGSKIRESGKLNRKKGGIR